MVENLGKLFIASGLTLPKKFTHRYLDWSFLREILFKLKINCVLDVGANQGQFAASLRRIGYSGYILSFEPIKSEFSVVTARFKNDSKWKGFNIGLGSEDGERTFNVAMECSQMSSFLNPTDPNWQIRHDTVEMRRLDSIFDNLLSQLPQPARVFLKMDTQGYNLEVIKGAGQSIKDVLGLHVEMCVEPGFNGMPSYLDELITYQQLGFALMNLSEISRTNRGNLWYLTGVLTRTDKL